MMVCCECAITFHEEIGEPHADRLVRLREVGDTMHDMSCTTCGEKVGVVETEMGCSEHPSKITVGFVPINITELAIGIDGSPESSVAIS